MSAKDLKGLHEYNLKPMFPLNRNQLINLYGFYIMGTLVLKSLDLLKFRPATH